MRHAFIFIFLCWSGYASAQLNGQYLFHYLDQTDGLLHSQVRGIGQDAKGFIWILTYNGLQRYDGSRFLNFQAVVNPVSGYMTRSELDVDTSDGKINVVKGDHMVRLDPKTMSMKIFEVKDLISHDPGYPPSKFIGENGTSWLVGPKGAIKTEQGTNKTLLAFLNGNSNQQHQNNYILYDSLHGRVLDAHFF